MSDLVEFEDLGLLDARDLRAVLKQVPEDQLLAALAGVPAGLRQCLLSKLPPIRAARLEKSVTMHGPVSFESVAAAQRALVEALCRMSRVGQVAFDDPADMVA